MKYTTFLSLVAALPAAYGVAFGGPEPTAIGAERVFGGMSPKPTTAPSVNELRKRQSSLDPETCGWVDADFSSPVACSAGRTCMLYKSAGSGMAGCCAGRDTQNCDWASSCIDRSQYSSSKCGASCLLNTFIRKCTGALEPYCVSMTYPGEGVADFACDSTSRNTVYTVRQTATDGVGDTTSTRLPTVAAGAVTIPTGSSSSSSTRRTSRKLAVGVIVGIVIAVLFLLFFVIIGIIMFLKKKKKSKQLADNAQIVANAQASRPQSQFQPQMHQPQQAPMPTQSPQPPVNGYFPPPNQQEQKYGHASVHEYALTPISNPSTPAPAYAQPYMAPNVPPMPQQHTGNYQPPANGAHEAPSPVQYMGQYQPPVNGAHEVASPDLGRQPQQQQQQLGASPVQQYSSPNVGAHEVHASSVPHAPGNTTGRPVYEMGGR